jgi:prepilin signal peptidase PulO-like enzyme (type II secretory pathway)
MVALDQSFSSHTTLTLAHIIPALGFVLVTPFALLRRFATIRWPRRLLYPLGIVVGATAYAMSAYAVGGWTERFAVFFFNTLFLYSLVRAWVNQSQGQDALSRQWLMRAVAVLLGIATVRPVMGIFFATRGATHLSPHKFFGIAFWIGFSINWIVAEVAFSLRNRQVKA